MVNARVLHAHNVQQLLQFGLQQGKVQSVLLHGRRIHFVRKATSNVWASNSSEARSSKFWQTGKSQIREGKDATGHLGLQQRQLLRLGAVLRRPRKHAGLIIRGNKEAPPNTRALS